MFGHIFAYPTFSDKVVLSCCKYGDWKFPKITCFAEVEQPDLISDSLLMQGLCNNKFEPSKMISFCEQPSQQEIQSCNQNLLDWLFERFLKAAIACHRLVSSFSLGQCLRQCGGHASELADRWWLHVIAHLKIICLIGNRVYIAIKNVAVKFAPRLPCGKTMNLSRWHCIGPDLWSCLCCSPGQPAHQEAKDVHEKNSSTQ